MKTIIGPSSNTGQHEQEVIEACRSTLSTRPAPAPAPKILEIYGHELGITALEMGNLVDTYRILFAGKWGN